MAFAIPKLKRLKSGAFSARKVIPKDVRDEYCARFGGGWEERFYAKAGTPVGEAKRALNDWLAEIERRIAAIRDDAAGKGRSLTSREALALAGEWYLWLVGRHEDDPGDAEDWEGLRDHMRDALVECAPTWFRKDESLDPDWTWTEAEEVRVRMRPLVADKAERPNSWPAVGLR
jgi:hypothetical protein